ncbi:LysM peptidoglycan-binding domain-containing protein [Paenibacillus sp. TH7-28]
MKIHIVKKGDTLFELSKKYNVPLQKLIEANPQIANPDMLNVGEKVKIPAEAVPIGGETGKMYKHVVKQGDTLWKLAKAWGLSLQALIAANPQLKDPNELTVGEIVHIPAGAGPVGGEHGNPHPNPHPNPENIGTMPAQTGKKSTAPIAGMAGKKSTAPIAGVETPPKANIAPEAVQPKPVPKEAPKEEVPKALPIQEQPKTVPMEIKIEVEQIQYETTKLQPTKIEPIMHEPIKYEPPKFEPIHYEPAKYEPIAYTPMKTEPTSLAPISYEPMKSEPYSYGPVSPAAYEPMKSEPQAYAPLTMGQQPEYASPYYPQYQPLQPTSILPAMVYPTQSPCGCSGNVPTYQQPESYHPFYQYNIPAEAVSSSNVPQFPQVQGAMGHIPEGEYPGLSNAGVPMYPMPEVGGITSPAEHMGYPMLNAHHYPSSGPQYVSPESYGKPSYTQGAAWHHGPGYPPYYGSPMSAYPTAVSPLAQAPSMPGYPYPTPFTQGLFMGSEPLKGEVSPLENMQGYLPREEQTAEIHAESKPAGTPEAPQAISAKDVNISGGPDSIKTRKKQGKASSTGGAGKKARSGKHKTSGRRNPWINA